MDKRDFLMYSTLLLGTASYLLFTNRNRRYAVRPMNRERKRYGHFENLLEFMKNQDEEQFFKYLRMTPAMFNHLLNITKSDLTKDKFKNPLSPEHRLAMTLHYLSEGCSMQQIAWDYYVGKATVHCVVKETCDVLWKHLSPIYLPVPSKADWSEIATGFFNKWNMPNCIGALDGKHVVIQSPKHSGTDFFSYKKSFSIILMATCDADYKFTFVDIGGAGSNHDSTVFRESIFGTAFLRNELEIPDSKYLSGSNVLLPHFLVADQAFPLHEHIMRPFPGDRLDEKRNVFNYRISRARRCIENAFGILVQRWRILRKPIIADISMCERIVKASVVLHNYIQREEKDLPITERRYCPTGYADYLDVNGQFHVGRWAENGITLNSVGRLGANNACRNVQQNREKLADYFISDAGSVPWQWQHVRRGRVPI